MNIQQQSKFNKLSAIKKKVKKLIEHKPILIQFEVVESDLIVGRSLKISLSDIGSGYTIYLSSRRLIRARVVT